MERRGLEAAKRVAYYEYNFAVDGGAVGDITLRGPGLPAGAIITDGKIHVQTALTSGGVATAALKIESSEDVLAATAKASLSLNAILDVVPARTAATAIRVTANGKKVVMTVGTAAFTAGRLVVALEYF